ncbi:MAG: sensor histidine kinase [Singulisphaera sp.]
MSSRADRLRPSTPTLLGELLDNLLDNAGKYGDPGTPIFVRLGRGGQGVSLSVEDRGAGVAEAEIPHLFDPFYRTDAARGQGTAGLGLGLSVASRLAGLFGGKIRVESTPGLGSSFTIHLPDADQDRALEGSERDGAARKHPGVIAADSPV